MIESVESLFRQLKGGLAGSALTSSAPLALVVAMGAILSFRSHTVLRQDRDMVVHTYQVIGSVRQLLLVREEAESAQNGFVITGDPASLARYEKARTQMLPATLADLDRLLIRNRGQQERLARMRSLLQEKFKEYENAIQLRRSQGFEAAQALIKTQAVQGQKDLVRALVSEMDNVEEGLLKERAGHVAASEKRILLVGLMTATVSIGVRLYLAKRASKT